MRLPTKILSLLSDRPSFAQIPLPQSVCSPDEHIVQETARNIFKAGYRNHYVGLFWSRKNGCLVPFESGLERDCCLHLESLPSITGYKAQPGLVTYRMGGRMRKAYPDFLVVDQHQNLIEVKHSDKASRPEMQEKVAILQQLLADRGFRYGVLTERDIRTPRLKVVRAVYTQARLGTHPQLRSALLDWIATEPGQASYEEVCELLCRLPATVRAALDGAVLDGAFELDLAAPLNSQLMICRGRGVEARS